CFSLMSEKGRKAVRKHRTPKMGGASSVSHKFPHCRRKGGMNVGMRLDGLQHTPKDSLHFRHREDVHFRSRRPCLRPRITSPPRPVPSLATGTITQPIQRPILVNHDLSVETRLRDRLANGECEGAVTLRSAPPFSAPAPAVEHLARDAGRLAGDFG